MSIHTEHKSTEPGEPGHNEGGHFFNPGSGGNGGDNVPPHFPNDGREAPQPEHPRRRRGLIAAGVAATATALVATSVAVGVRLGRDNSEHQGEPRPTTGQSLEPTPTPSPTPSTETSTPPAPTETIVVPEKDDSASIEYMRGLDIADFNQLPRAQRLKLAAWDAYRADQGDYHAFYGNSDQAFIPPNPDTGYPGEFLYDKNPYNSVFPQKGASKFDDGQKIMDQALFWDQMFNAQAADQNNIAGPLDINHALQIMGATRSYYVDNKHPEQTRGTYDEQAHFIRQEKTTSHLAVSERYMATNTSQTLLSGEDVEGNPIQYKDVTYVSHGNTYVARFVFETVTIQVTNPQTSAVEPVTVNMWVTYSDAKKVEK